MGLGAVGGSALASFELEKQIGDRRFEDFKKSPLVQRELEAFDKSIAKLTSTDDFFKDRRLVSFVTQAFGKPDEAQFIGRLRAVLSEPVDQDDALMYRLNDRRFEEMARTLQFAESGLDQLRDPDVQAQLKESYLEYAYEQEIAAENPAIANALYFERNAGKITDYFEALGDQTIRNVFQTVFGLPDQLALQSLTSQREAFASRFDLEDLQDPKYIQKTVRQYLATVDINNGPATSGNAWQLQLFPNSGGGLNLIV